MNEQEVVSDQNSTTDYVLIKDLKPGRYQQIFRVAEVTFTDAMVTKAAGSRFARVVLKDITGSIEGIVWDHPHTNFIRPGEFYSINLTVEEYKGETQFRTSRSFIRSVDTPLNIYDYIKGTSVSELTTYANEVENVLTTLVDDEHYLNVIGNAFARFDIMHALKTSPYGLSGPLAYKGGLLVHIVGALRIAKTIVAQAKEHETPINASLVFTSCLFRSIGWHTTTTFTNGKLEALNAFYMTGINRASAQYVNNLITHVEKDLDMKIPEAKQQALENACNDVADIKTIEGRIAAQVDSMIDILHFSGETLKQKTNGNWTEDFFTGHNA